MRIPLSPPGEGWAVMTHKQRYYISSQGRIWDGQEDRFVTPSLGSQGYPEFAGRTLHRIVCDAFLGPRPAGMDTRHLDGDKQNNAVSNLAYGTHAENVRDSILHGTHVNTRKTHCPQGHAYDEANTRYSARGDRECRACKAAKQRARWARLQQAKRTAAA